MSAQTRFNVACDAERAADRALSAMMTLNASSQAVQDMTLAVGFLQEWRTATSLALGNDPAGAITRLANLLGYEVEVAKITKRQD